MRRDTQIGVILGVVIIGIIAIFLSTRTNVKKSENKELISNKEKEISFESTVDIFEDDTFIAETLESEIGEIATLEEKKGDETLNNEDEQLTSKGTEKVVEETEETTVAEFTAETKLAEKIAEDKEITAMEIKKETKVLTHKVELNDNLFSLAKRYYGDPKKWIEIYNANIDVIYDRNSLPIGDELIIPDVEILAIDEPEKIATAEPLKTVTESPAEKRIVGKKHKVKTGDTLYALSRSYYGNANKWRLIYNANKDILGDNNMLIIGQKLTIPDNGLLANKREKINHYPLRSQRVVDNSANVSHKTGHKTYKIKKGDTLYDIARLHFNDESKWKLIFEANKNVLTNSNSIPAGKTIIIPK